MAKGGTVRKKPKRPPRPPIVYPAEVDTTPKGGPTGHAHPRCYANALNDCDTKISLEHYVSANVLEDLGAFTVTNPDRGWKNKSLSVRALGANILCERHNSNLSGLDTVGGKFVRAIEAIQSRKLGLPVEHGGRQVFNGLDVERWMLKVLCGFVAVQRGPIAIEWLRILFAGERLHSPAGMHLNVAIGEVVAETTGQLAFDLAKDQAGATVGISLTLHGIRFLLGLDGERVYDSNDLGKESVLRPPRILVRNSLTGAGYRIHFGWPPGEEGDDITLNWRPRD